MISQLRVAVTIPLAFLIWASGLVANTEHTVISSDGQRPYLIVTPDTKGASQRELGIYVADAMGNWGRIFSGSLQSGRFSNGILSQLALHQQDGRYYAMAVIDGKLCLFHIGSSEADSSSFAELGSALHPVLDLLHASEIMIPKITSLDHVEVAAGAPSPAGQTVLISIKHPSLHGDGITFAFFVCRGESKQRRLELAGAPVVIDYKFQETSRLRTLLSEVSESKGVVSRTLLKSLSRLEKDDPPAFLGWRKRTLEHLQAIDSGETVNPLAYYDVQSGRAVLSGELKVKLGTLRHPVYQVYDPLKGMDGLYLAQNDTKVSASDFDLIGRVDIDRSADEPNYRFYPSSSHEVALMYFNHELYAIWEPADGNFGVIKIDRAGLPLPTKLELATKTILYQAADSASSRVRELYVFLSTETENGQKTECIVIQERAGAFTIKKRLPIYPEFMPSDEIEERIKEGEDQLLFDNLTPRFPTTEAYHQAFEETIPLIDVTKSQPEKMVQAYLKPISEQSVNNFITYREFESKGAVTAQSGLYISDTFQIMRAVALGQLLQRHSQTHPEMLVKVVPLGGGPSLRVGVTGLDAGHAHGANGFKIAVTGTPGDEGLRQNPFLPWLDEVSFNLPFSDLTGAQILQTGDKKKLDVLYLLLHFNSVKQTQGVERGGGVFVVGYRFSLDKKTTLEKLVVDKTRSGWVFKGDISDAELKHRLRRGANDGHIYFVVDPDVDPTSVRFKLQELSTGKEILPNISGDRPIKLISSDEGRDLENDRNFDFRKSASWEIYSLFKLRERYPKIFPEGGDDAFKSMLKGAELFLPGVQETIDQIANSHAPAQHTVLLVAPHLKQVLTQLIWAIWADRDRAKHSFCTSNFKLKVLNVDPKRATQDEVLDNLDSARDAASRDKVILLGDMADVLAIERPTTAADDNERPGFFLTVPSTNLPDQRDVDHARIWPHLFYLIQTEGERLSLAEFKSATARRDAFSTIIISTPEEWERLRVDARTEVDAGMLRDVVVNRRFFQGTWKLSGPGSSHTSPQIKNLKGYSDSEFDREVFPSLAGVIDGLADITQRPKHKVLLVPAELKPSIQNLVLSRWLQAGSQQSSWSIQNDKFELYALDPTKAGKKTEILENLEAMRNNPGSVRTVLLADLADIARVGRSYAWHGDHHGLITDVGVGTGSSAHGDGVRPALVGEAVHIPHLLYLLACEGKPTQLADWERGRPTPDSGLLLLGTREEWESLKKDLNPENRVNLADAFEIEELPVPSIEARVQLLRNVMKRPQIQGLRYRFDASKVVMQSSSLSGPDEEMDAVLRFMVNKCELLARQANKEVITTFIQFLNVFTASVVEDDVLRKRRVIDRVFVERLYSKIFSLPLNVSVLPPDDPLVRLNNTNAVLDLQAAGYEGPIDLKMRVIQALLAQTRVDPVRPIPSSIIVFGDTGSGKTFLFKSIARMLGLKFYDFAKPTELDSQAIIVNVGKLKPTPKPDKEKDNEPNQDRRNGGPSALSQSPELMTVDHAIRHLQNFLSLPSGYRGYILFDDLHLASDEVRAELVTFMRSLFEATNGMYRVVNVHGKAVEIPVRNLNLFMTLNPPDDVDKLKKFHKKGDELEVVLAGLSGQDVPVDRSFLERWSLIINLSLFPSEAKAPKLRDSVREAARDTFNNQNQLVLVAASAIQSVATRFKDENVRTFLSRATPELVSRVSELPIGTPLSIVVPRDKVSMAYATSSWEAAGRTGTDIGPFIKQSLVAIPIGSQFAGRLELLKTVLDTYRIQALGGLVRAMTQDMRFAGSLDAQRKLLAHLMHALVSHLTQNPFLPFATLNLDPFDFGATAGPRKVEFSRLIQKQSTESKRYFPFIFGDEMAGRGLLSDFLGKRDQSHSGQRSRAEVLTENVDRVSPALTTFLEELLQVQSILTLPKPENWCRALVPAETAEASTRLGGVLSDVFLDFYGGLFESSLIETARPQDFSEVTTYDAARLYFYVLDKAIARLPWGKVTNFLVKGLEIGSTDMGMGQLQGLQHYIFSSRASLLRSAAPEMLLQMASNSDAYRQWTDDMRFRASTNFGNKCAKLLAQP